MGQFFTNYMIKITMAITMVNLLLQIGTLAREIRIGTHIVESYFWRY